MRDPFLAASKVLIGMGVSYISNLRIECKNTFLMIILKVVESFNTSASRLSKSFWSPQDHKSLPAWLLPAGEWGGILLHSETFWVVSGGSG